MQAQPARRKITVTPAASQQAPKLLSLAARIKLKKAAAKQQRAPLILGKRQAVAAGPGGGPKQRGRLGVQAGGVGKRQAGQAGQRRAPVMLQYPAQQYQQVRGGFRVFRPF